MNLKGSVIFPTQAEIYLDGVLIGKQTIIPGSFDLKNLYSYTGSHNVEVLLKDPFGNVQKISYLAYFSTQMLRQGCMNIVIMLVYCGIITALIATIMTSRRFPCFIAMV